MTNAERFGLRLTLALRRIAAVMPFGGAELGEQEEPSGSPAPFGLRL
jgi:hypothetical protein